MPIKYHMVLDDPEYKDHALALGRMLGHWGELEMYLMAMTKYLFQVGGDNINHVKTDFLYKEFFNIRSKIRLLKRLNNFFVNDEILKVKINDLLSNAEDLNYIRNHHVHARWQPKAGFGETSNLLRRISLGPPNNITHLYKQTDYLTAQDINDCSAEIVELSLSFQELLNQVSPLSEL